MPELLWHGPEAYGCRGQVWTCARIAKVIEGEFGARYHKDHVGRVFKSLGWTPQQPIQRDDEAIRRWRDETWPDLRQRARRELRPLVFEDESGFYLLRAIVKTYAPEGLTPVLREKQTRDHLSVMDGMTPEGHVPGWVYVLDIATHQPPPVESRRRSRAASSPSSRTPRRGSCTGFRRSGNRGESAMCWELMPWPMFWTILVRFPGKRSSGLWRRSRVWAQAMTRNVGRYSRLPREVVGKIVAPAPNPNP